MSRELSRELLTFLHKSPSSFHAVYNLGQMLEKMDIRNFSRKTYGISNRKEVFRETQ